MENMNLSDRPSISEKNLALVVYILYAACFFVGVSFFIAFIINYIKRGEIQDPIIKSHYAWQIGSAWVFLIGFILSVIGVLTVTFISGGAPGAILIAGFFVIANSLRFLYCIIKGILRLNDGKPMK
ncbi:hypothetical protein RF679_07450 [Undibacterium cyanobacteriorum]|uniref:DUF4870 domain-containing protein n=1 Tax=Undibacterium cyanobacteriorum TaxID=3073561 RepID=A0ABY9RN39_9BURK|nr:hypothetical protein [Undibacterium sp. 20NA77.5]WMW82110.1 hypothetical protein RF679_07450 [Undibacterium sp. 20NA77.5]